MAEVTLKRSANRRGWFGTSAQYCIRIEYRVRLDKYDVLYIPAQYEGTPRWYLHTTKERCDTFADAFGFITSKLLASDEVLHMRDVDRPATTTNEEKENRVPISALKLKELSVDELALELENDQKFYTVVSSAVCDLDAIFAQTTAKIDREDGYKRYRAEVYRAIRAYVGPAYRALNANAVTTKLSGYFFQRYAGTTNLRAFTESLSNDLQLYMSSPIQNIGELADYADRISTASFPQTIPETAMSTTPAIPAIETRTFIFGDNAANMTDEQIFAGIAKIEAEIKKLDGVENKPKKLQAKIDAMKADIAKLVEYVDAR